MHICALTVTCTVHLIGMGCYICESIGDQVIDHLSNFYVTRIVERIGPVAYRLYLPEEFFSSP